MTEEAGVYAVLAEKSAIFLLAAEAMLIQSLMDDLPNLREAVPKMHQALRSILCYVADLRGRKKARIPDLLNGQFSCVEPGDANPSVFKKLAAAHYVREDCAHLVIAVLRETDPDLGLPQHSRTKEWTADECAQACGWLRLFEHVNKAIELRTYDEYRNEEEFYAGIAGKFDFEEGTSE